MVEISASSNASQFFAATKTWEIKARAATLAGLLEAAEAAKADAQKNASGRPGPNVLTGRLRSSIVAQPISADAVAVGSSVIYARKTERRYPFLRPASDRAAAETASALAKRWREVNH